MTILIPLALITALLATAFWLRKHKPRKHPKRDISDLFDVTK